MIRLRGDHSSLIAALLLHWSEQQIGLPLSRQHLTPTRRDHQPQSNSQLT
jgi:hypothetical protein